MLNPLFEIGRIERSKEVVLKFTDSENFLVLEPEDRFDKKTGIQVANKDDVKYHGKVMSHVPHIEDDCDCPSFYHGNVEKWIVSHGFAFQCKHLVAARELRYAGYEGMRHQ